MIDIRSLYHENRKKHDELSAFHWFIKALGINYRNLEILERPDFIIQLDSRKIGIEVTLAERRSLQRFSMQQIESAQDEFARNLLQSVAPNLPLDIGLIFEDGIAVDNKGCSKSISIIATLINQISKSMRPHTAELLVRTENDLKSISQRKHICPQIPDFLQHIQLLLNDGHERSVVTGSRGCHLEYFTEGDLLSILDKKHKALSGYMDCDEQWLVIVSGQVPPLFVTHEGQPEFMIPSIATSFYKSNIDHPIESSFDKVYFFRSPADVTLLT
jgi:hypothetical protein